MKRFIRCPEPRQLVTITGDPVVEKDGTPVIASMRWFVQRLLLDPRFGDQGFESMLIATDILRAAREADAVMVLPDVPHWELLCKVARQPTGGAAYVALIVDTNCEFARAIIGATVDEPQLSVAAE